MKGDETKVSNADRVAQQVSAFYERHPYPPPIDASPPGQPTNL
jgi:hypothetical protein